jgi:hypothetical protein
MQAIAELGPRAATRRERALQLIPMLDIVRYDEVGSLEVVRHWHPPSTAWDALALLLLFLLTSHRLHTRDNEKMLFLDAVVFIFNIILRRINFATTLLLGGTLLFTTDTFIIFSAYTPPISSGDTMAMAIAEITLCHGDLAVETIPEFHTGLTTGGVGTYELITMLNPVGDDKVGSLEIMIHGHSTSTAGNDDCTLRQPDRAVNARNNVVRKGSNLLIEKTNSLESIDLIIE